MKKIIIPRASLESKHQFVIKKAMSSAKDVPFLKTGFRFFTRKKSFLLPDGREGVLFINPENNNWTVDILDKSQPGVIKKIVSNDSLV